MSSVEAPLTRTGANLNQPQISRVATAHPDPKA
ncbi:hypothetical protein DSM112329_01119 [Paraconexibacter sp. AEG42_29]|uniref:Uncharacterized protein n=1 Tax=Paraconexibacter sp. AEG42_29 TaxID=2997339 RepID=A0AAU7AS12_9ACTN